MHGVTSASICSCPNWLEKINIKENSECLRGCGIDGSRENGGEIGQAHTEGRILKTETGEVVDGGDISDTTAIHPANTSSDIDPFLERPGGNLDFKKEKNDSQRRRFGKAEVRR